MSTKEKEGPRLYPCKKCNSKAIFSRKDLWHHNAFKHKMIINEG